MLNRRPRPIATVMVELSCRISEALSRNLACSVSMTDHLIVPPRWCMGRNEAVADVDSSMAFAVASYELSPCQRPRGGESIANGMSNCNAALTLELPSHLGCGDAWISFTITQQEDTSPPAQ